MWDLLLIPLYAYVMTATVMFTLGVIFDRKDETWDEDKHWAIDQLYEYYLRGDLPQTREATETFLKKVGYPSEEEWREQATE